MLCKLRQWNFNAVSQLFLLNRKQQKRVELKVQPPNSRASGEKVKKKFCGSTGNLTLPNFKSTCSYQLTIIFVGLAIYRQVHITNIVAGFLCENDLRHAPEFVYGSRARSSAHYVIKISASE